MKKFLQLISEETKEKEMDFHNFVKSSLNEFGENIPNSKEEAKSWGSKFGEYLSQQYQNIKCSMPSSLKSIVRIIGLVLAYEIAGPEISIISIAVGLSFLRGLKQRSK